MTSEELNEPVAGERLAAALPPDVRLFHIGPAKTGTTSLQAAAAATRPEQLAHGVLYPGQARSQRAAVAAFLGRSVQYNRARDHEAEGTPSLQPWDDLMAEVSASPHLRAWFGHEYAAGAAPSQVADFAAAIGPQLHVVVTLRSFTRMLPSIWQESNKAGNTGGFDGFVKRMLTVAPEERERVPFHLRHDHGGLVRRWAGVVGLENVTVVVADDHDHSFTVRAFEDLLGLPRGLMASAEIPPRASNRTMSVPEIEFVRQINKELRERGLPWSDYERLMIKGGITRMLSHRRPRADEPRLKLSRWAAARAEEFQGRSVEAILASGVRVIGDPNRLLEPAVARSSKQEAHISVEWVPLDAAVEAAVGIIAAASGHSADFEKLPPAPMTLRRALGAWARERTGRDVHSVRDLLGRRP